jgi:hypothetical protein
LIERVLATARLLRADAACPVLERALVPLAGSAWPEVAWRFSRLTADGCPVQFGISTKAGAIRAAFECAPPETPEHARLDAALALLAQLDLPPPPSGQIAEARALQARHRLRYGCWTGLRFGPAVTPKLYIELPRAIPGEPRMLGLDAASGGRELYATLVTPDEATLRRQIAVLDGPTQDALLETLAETVGHKLARVLEWVSIGVSWFQAEHTRRVALFCRARAVAGGSEALVPRFAHVPGYLDVIAARGAVPDHGVLSFVPHADGRIELRAGLPGC